MKQFYYYSEKKIDQLIINMFIGFKAHNISVATLKNNSFKNQNILFYNHELFHETLKSAN